MMKKRDLKADLETCNKATPGPWTFYEVEIGCGERTCPYEKEREDLVCLDCSGVEIYNGAHVPEVLTLNCGEYDGMNDADAEFIAQAREGWPHAIERAMKAEALVRKYEETEFTPEEEVNDMVRRFTSFLCEMTGGLMSKPNYTLKDMIAVADDYQQTICDESLQEEVKRANEAEALARELVGALDKAHKYINDINSLYGKGLEVHNWHLNGEPEALDNFIDDSGGWEVEEPIVEALVKAKEVLGDD